MSKAAAVSVPDFTGGTQGADSTTQPANFAICEELPLQPFLAARPGDN
jgi:hypothetical protein